MARPLTITAYGNAQVDTAEKQFGNGSLLLDGSGDYLIVTNDSNDTLSNPITGFSEPWCISLWIKAGWTFGSSPSSTQYLVANTASTFPWYLILQGTNSPVGVATVKILVSGAGYVGTETRVAQLFASSGEAQWVNIVAQHNGANSLFLYVNGIRSGLTTVNEGLYTDDVIIGAEWNGGSTQNHFHGWIDEILFFGENLQEIGSGIIDVPSVPFQPNITELKFLIHANGTDGSTTFTDDVGVQGAADLSGSFAILEADGRTFLRNTVELPAVTMALAATAVEDPSIVFLGNDIYTWDETDTWDLITGIDSGGQDQWRAAEIISAAFTQSAEGGFLISPEASLSTSISQVCVARLLNGGVSSQALSTDLTVSVDIFRNASSDLTVNTDVTVQADMFRGGSADLATEFDSQSTAKLTLAGATDLSVVTEFEATGRILKLANIDLDNFATLDATAEVDIQAQSQLSSQFDLETRGGLILEPNEAYDYTWDTVPEDRWDHFLLDRWEPRGVILISQTELDVAVGLVIEAEATLTTTVALTTDSLITRGASTSLQVSTAIDCDANMFRGADCALDSVFALECQALKLVRGSAELDTETTQTATGSVTIDGSTSLSSQTLLEASGAFLRLGETALDFSVQQEALGRLIAGGSAVLDFVSFVISEGLSRTPVLGQASLESQFNLTVTADNFAIASIELFDEIALTADANMFRGGRAELEMQGFTLTTGTRVALGQALLNIEFTGDFNGDLRLLASDFVYKILQESRNIDIASETRIQGIYADSRVVPVSSETRDYKVLQESREIAIEDFT